MNRKAKIEFKGDITNNSVHQLDLVLKNIMGTGIQDIILVIHSDGGDTKAAIEAYNRFYSLNDSISLTTCNSGACESAAFLLFLTGGRRIALRQSQFMFHEGEFTFSAVLTERQVRAELKNIELLNRGYIEIIEKYFGDRQEVARLYYEGFYFGAEEAQRQGVVDELTDKLPGDRDINYYIYSNGGNIQVQQFEVM